MLTIEDGNSDIRAEVTKAELGHAILALSGQSQSVSQASKQQSTLRTAPKFAKLVV